MRKSAYTLIRSSLALSALLFAGAATAQSTDPQATSADAATPAQSTDAGASGEKAGFGTLDADHNGQVSRSEAKADARTEADFDTLDADKDGALTPSELAGQPGQDSSTDTPKP